MATTPHAGAGTTFVFAGTTFTVTNITYSVSDVSGTTEELDISHLGLTTGATVLTMKKPLVGSAAGDTGKEVTMDYHGSVPVVGGSSGTLNWWAFTHILHMPAKGALVDGAVCIA